MFTNNSANFSELLVNDSAVSFSAKHFAPGRRRLLRPPVIVHCEESELWHDPTVQFCVTHRILTKDTRLTWVCVPFTVKSHTTWTGVEVACESFGGGSCAREGLYCAFKVERSVHLQSLV